MGPRPFSRGDRCPPVPAKVLVKGFNGAATFQSRRPGDTTYQHRPEEASMGPRPFSRGDLVVQLKDGAFVGWLQWGRDLSVAETRHSGTAAASTYTLQWGRDLSVAETSSKSSSGSGSSSLQWGRDLSVAETSTRHAGGHRAAELQWGRDLSVAETLPPSAGAPGVSPASMGPRPFSRGDVPGPC